MYTSRDPGLYLPTRVPFVFPIPSPTVKSLQVYVRRNEVVIAPAPISLASTPSGDSSHVSSLVLLLSPMPASLVAHNIDFLPLLFVRVNALVLSILLLNLSLVITYLLPYMRLLYLSLVRVPKSMLEVLYVPC